MRFLFLFVSLIVASLLFFALPYLVRPDKTLTFAPEAYRQLKPNEVIVVETETDGAGKHLGDKIFYRVKVFYNPEKVEIDTAALQNAITFEPFRVLRVESGEIEISPETLLYFQEYTLQLISGNRDSLYFFAQRFPVYYTNKDNGTKQSIEGTLAPVFITSRFPPDMTGFPLKHIKGELQPESPMILAVFLVVAGIFLVALCVVWLFKQSLKARAERKGMRVSWGDITDLYDLTYTIEREVMPLDPRRAAGMLYQACRLLLARKEGIDLLTPNFDRIPEDRRREFLGYLGKCQVAYRPEDVTLEEAKDLLQEFRRLLTLYCQHERGEARQ